MNLRQIEVFRAVMLAGSVSDAARMLHVSQPGISRMLGHIELQLGVTLFERGRGKLRATPEAQLLFSEVEQVFRGVRRIDEVARGLKSGGGLVLRVLSSPSTALEIVPRALAELADAFPTSRLYMETQLVREMSGQLLRQEADLAISTLPIEHALLQSEVVGRWSLACVFQAGHPFEGRRSVGLRDIMAERLIAFAPDTPQGALIAQWCRDHRIEPQSRIEVRSGQVACALAACGAGVAVVDTLTARHGDAGRLGFRPISRAPSFQVHAVRNRNVPPSLVLQGLVERVRQGFRTGRPAASGKQPR